MLQKQVEIVKIMINYLYRPFLNCGNRTYDNQLIREKFRRRLQTIIKKDVVPFRRIPVTFQSKTALGFCN